MRRRDSAQSLVEFALAIPFIVLVLVSLMYFGRVFYVKQAVALATQEGARILSRTPGSSDPNTGEFIAGFTGAGSLVNPDSVVVGVLGAARLLSDGSSGDLPPGSAVSVLLPGDVPNGSNSTVADGTIGLQIEYPFRFLESSFEPGSSEFSESVDVWTGEDSFLSFINFNIIERSIALQEVYQP